MIHELSTWEEIANEYRHEPAYRLIVRRAEEKIDEFSDAYKEAHSELQELEEVLLDRMEYLTRPITPDGVRHEFDRADESHADEIKRITAERDLYKMLSCR